MHVRYARLEDIGRIDEIMRTTIERLDIYTPEARQAILASYNLQFLQNRFAADAYCLYVGEDDEGVQGFGLIELDRGTLNIEWICVDPLSRHKRLGPKLYRFAIEIGRMIRLPKAWGLTLATNRSSQRFLPRIGFRIMCEMKKHWYGLDYVYWEYVYADEAAAGFGPSTDIDVWPEAFIRNSE
jgi:ribosomal protein S18 acetylase RimI-like enzyme